MLSAGIACLLLIGAIEILVDFGSDNVQGTYVEGPIYPPGTTWDLADSPYIVIADVTVMSGATLTIEPGVEVKFDRYYNINVEGTLLAIGEELSKINITSNKLLPMPGDWNGIQVSSTGHADIEYCNISYGSFSIHLKSSSNNTITDNDILLSSDYGIYLNSSIENNISNNKMIQTGIGVYGNLLEHWNTHEIDALNTVNGKSIYYWKNRTGGAIPPGAGQVILANCTNVNIENQDLNYGSVGIELGFSSYNYITNNNASLNEYYGIYLYNSNGNSIVGNNASNNQVGIYLCNSNGSTISDNIMIEDGIVILGDLPEHWNTHEIDTLNTVSGKHVHYWKNRTGGAIPPGAGQVILANCTNVTIENQELTHGSIGVELGFSLNNSIINNNFSFNKNHGIYLFYSNGNSITNNTASLNNNYGVYLCYSKGNNISGNVAFLNHDDGIYLYHSDRNIIIGNNASLNNRHGIFLSISMGNDIEGNNASFNYRGIYLHRSSGNNIVNNAASFNINESSPTFDFGDGIYLFLSDWNNIVDNTASNNGRSCIRLIQSAENNIEGNTIFLSRGIGINLASSDENNVTGNIIFSDNNPNCDDGISLGGSNRNNITDNIIFSIPDDGISIYYSDGNNIINNNVSNTGQYGIEIFDSNWNDIINNTAFSHVDGIGIGLDGVRNTVSGNVVSHNWMGIAISRHENNITDNIVTNNNWGIILGSDKNNITYNTVSNNDYGIYLSSAFNNRIYHNNIIDNAVQAYDGTSFGNQWDNGYPSGGNYWSDWTSPDDFSGAGQSTPGSDGIVDKGIIGGGGLNPYFIDFDSFDKYPLTEMIVEPPPPPVPPTLYINVSLDQNDIILNWDTPPTPGIKHYLLYRSTSQTDFDFNDIWVNTSVDMEPGETEPIPLRTMWNDTGAAMNTTFQEYYYVIRAVNTLGQISSTSRTVGKWTRIFQSGVSTFSLPLEPIYPVTTDYLTSTMNADYIKYMDPGTHTWVQHDYGMGDTNNVEMMPGEGYEVKFSTQTNYTFTGMPGAMISYDDDPGFPGFDPFSEAKNLTVSIQPYGDVNLTWPEPSSMSDGRYEVYYSHKRDGFFKTLDVDYYRIGLPVDFKTNYATHDGASADNPGTRLYYMVVPFNASGVRGSSTYSIGIWTEGYDQGYDTLGLPLKLNTTNSIDWYCDAIDDTWGMNYFNVSGQRWMWHKTIMPEGIYDVDVVMCEGYQISITNATKFTFVGV